MDDARRQELQNTSTDELIALALACEDGDETYWEYLRTLHRRGGREVLDAALELGTSENPDERSLAADILAQISCIVETKYETTKNILEPVESKNAPDVIKDEAAQAILRWLETESDPDVLESLVYAVYHMRGRCKSAVDSLFLLKSHEVAFVRQAVATALFSFPSLEVGEVLAELAFDKEEDVQNWAAFSLSELSDWDDETPVPFDSASIREALFHCAKSMNSETRSHGTLGLAVRKDIRAFDLLVKELSEDEEIWHDLIKAATELADPRLCPYLEELKKDIDEEWPYIDEAIQACKCGRSE